MGAKCGKESDVLESKNHKYFKDRFFSYDELEDGLRKAGLESSNLIIGIDFTRSNETNGGYPYFPGDANLHSARVQPNLYQQVINIMGKTLAPFDDDNLIPAYGFGDATTTDRAVFPFLVDSTTGYEAPCQTFNHVLQIYNDILGNIANGQIKMSGPTSFSAIIKKAIEIVKITKSYHILLIICDGQVSNKQKDIAAIVEASNHPLSIVAVGVGKGPWEVMEEFDDEIPKRKFDNFQFVNYYKTLKESENSEYEFAKSALMEIPDQYNYIKKHILPYY